MSASARDGPVAHGGFWKPGTVAPGSTVERDDKADSADGGDVVLFNPNEVRTSDRPRRHVHTSDGFSPCTGPHNCQAAAHAPHIRCAHANIIRD
jgi:hypothetical protein